MILPGFCERKSDFRGVLLLRAFDLILPVIEDARTYGRPSLAILDLFLLRNHLNRRFRIWLGFEATFTKTDKGWNFGNDLHDR